MLYFHRTSSSPSTADTRLPPLLPAGGLVSCFNEKIGCIRRELLWAPASPLPPTCILACLSGIINCSLFTGSLAHTRCYAIISPILRKNKHFLVIPMYPYNYQFPTSLLSFTTQLLKRTASCYSLTFLFFHCRLKAFSAALFPHVSLEIALKGHHWSPCNSLSSSYLYGQ